MEREAMYDRWGNDVTPLCMYEDVSCLDNGSGQCSQEHRCPGYYGGCFLDLKRMK